MSSIMEILCYCSDIIINTDNGITYYWGSTKLCSLRLDNSFDELKNMVCRGTGWDLSKFDVDITWRMLGVLGSSISYTQQKLWNKIIQDFLGSY
jgi:hypothetical protein